MWEIDKRRNGCTVWAGWDAVGRRVWAVTTDTTDGVATEPRGLGIYRRAVALRVYRQDHDLPEPGRYGYRVVGGTRREPSGLVGLATTRPQAERLRRGSRVTTYAARERWTAEVWAAVRAEEDAGRIPRGLPLSVAAHS